MAVFAFVGDEGLFKIFDLMLFEHCLLSEDDVVSMPQFWMAFVLKV